MRTQNLLEFEIAELMISALNLQEMSAKQQVVHPLNGLLDPKQNLTNCGLAMDSINVLELSLAISKKYSIQLESDDGNWRDAVVSLDALAKFVESKDSQQVY